MSTRATTQQVETELQEAVTALHELNNYGYSLLKQMEGRPYEYSRRKHAFLLGLYAAAIAQVQGYILLIENKQYRVSSNQMRTLYEIWVNTRFLYCSRSNIYAWHLILMSDKRTMNRAGLLLGDGHISQDDYNKHVNTYNRRKALMRKKYPAWPDLIPDVIGKKSASPAERKKELNLRERCKIIDYYYAKYKRKEGKGMPMDKHYANLYPYFSSGAHADPVELSSIFKETDTHIHATIDGSDDMEGALMKSHAVYAFQYELIKYAKRYIVKQKPPKMPSWINIYARQIKLVK
jgi:hypothetical protein